MRRFLLYMLGAALPLCAGTIVGEACAATLVKSPRECNEELQKNEAALKAAGETAAAFIHACWYTSEPGKPTPVVANGSPNPGAGASKPSPSREASEAAPRAIRRPAARTFVRQNRQEPVERDGGQRRARPGSADQVDQPVRRIVAVPAPLGVGLARPTTVVDVNLPVVGQVPVPILPGLEPAAHVLVDNPAVPGLLTIRR